jgi:hypothetical protein
MRSHERCRHQTGRSNHGLAILRVDALILVITYYVARFFAALLTSLLAAIGFDTLPERPGISYFRTGIPPSVLVGRLALFFAMLFATVEAANRLGFTQLRDIVSTFIRFGGDVLLGAVILVIGSWLANLAYQVIRRASSRAGVAQIARYAILGLVIAMGLHAGRCGSGALVRPRRTRGRGTADGVLAREAAQRQ